MSEMSATLPGATPVAATKIAAPPPAPAEKLKQIEVGWQPATGKPVDLLAAVKIDKGSTNLETGLLLNKGGTATTLMQFQPPVTFRIVLKTDGQDVVRLAYGADQIIFNWDFNREELRIDGGSAGGKHKPGAGSLLSGQWVGIELVSHANEMVIYVDGVERYRSAGDFSRLKRALRIEAHSGEVSVKSVTMVKS